MNTNTNTNTSTPTNPVAAADTLSSAAEIFWRWKDDSDFFSMLKVDFMSLSRSPNPSSFV